MCLYEAVLEALLVLPTDVNVTNAKKKDFHYCSKVWDLFLFILFFFNALKLSYAHLGCIYLIKNTVKQ